MSSTALLMAAAAESRLRDNAPAESVPCDDVAHEKTSLPALEKESIRTSTPLSA
jgi:hypothetical protein